MTSLLAGAIGSTAYAAGFAATKLRQMRSAFRRAARVDWKQLRHGPVALRVPPGWGEIEHGQAGDLVVHNRPCGHRVDGDAVWYGSALELRIYAGAARETLAPMRSVVRGIGSPGWPVTADMRIAGGVGDAGWKLALAVLHGVRIEGDPATIVWPEQRPAERKAQTSRVLPAHSSRVARDFERFGSREWRDET